MNKLIILLGILVLPLTSQEREPELIVGLQTTNILWDNPAKSLIAPQVPEGEDFVQGGSFDVAQSGLEVRFDLPFGERSYVPFGIAYAFYSAREKIPINDIVRVYWRHDLDVVNFFSGYYYEYYKFNRMPVSFYSGIELKGTFIYDINFEQERVYDELPERSGTTSLNTKDAAFRLGTTFKTGIKSKFEGYFNLDLSLGYNILNVIGNDDGRGELFTPKKDFESNESMVHTLNVNILLRFFL